MPHLVHTRVLLAGLAADLVAALAAELVLVAGLAPAAELAFVPAPAVDQFATVTVVAVDVGTVVAD